MQEKRKFHRKVDDFLSDWKRRSNHKPLIVRGARQIGKSEAIRYFIEHNYSNSIEINFALQPEYRTIFDNGFEVDKILRNISLINPTMAIVPYKTVIFFDELQDCVNAATSLKAFNLDGRFDVICSGSMLGINYQEIESNSVGNKEDYEMYSMDFEEFLWAKGYSESQIESSYQSMRHVEPLSELEMRVMMENFKEYMIVGGMPEAIDTFITNKNYSGVLNIQKQILRDYEEDITKYADGVDKARILNAYRKIPVFLGNENKKFQITKLENGARNREYAGVVDWLADAGIVNVCYCMDLPELPLKGNYNPEMFRVYFADTGLLIGSLDDEAQDDLRKNQNFNTYKGAIYENIMADMLKKEGYGLYFYKNEKSTVKMDFMVRDARSLIPVEVKATNGATVSLNNLINSDKYPDIKYGIKFADRNVGFNGKFYTFPYFLGFLLKKFLNEETDFRIEEKSDGEGLK